MDMCKCTNQEKKVMNALRESNCIMDLHHTSHNLDLEEYINSGDYVEITKILGTPKWKFWNYQIMNPIILQTHNVALPSSLIYSNVSLRWKITKRYEVGARFLVRNILKVEGHVGILKWGLTRVKSKSIIHTDLHKPNNKLISV